MNRDGVEVEQLLRVLHIQELINWDGETVDAAGLSSVWKDYLRSRFRLDTLREPRALVVADVMADALKRAPQTVTRHYRRAASLRLRELLGKFNFQRVPKRLFDFAEFAPLYKGATPEEIAAGLDADTESCLRKFSYGKWGFVCSGLGSLARRVPLWPIFEAGIIRTP